MELGAGGDGGLVVAQKPRGFTWRQARNGYALSPPAGLGADGGAGGGAAGAARSA